MRSSGTAVRAGARLRVAALAVASSFALVAGAAGCLHESRGCATNDDCGAGWSCLATVCRKLCNVTSDCWPPAIVCMSGVCQPVPTSACSGPLDCLGDPRADTCGGEGFCVCGNVGAPCAPGEVCGVGGCLYLGGGGAVGPFPSAGGVSATSEHYQLEVYVAPGSPVGTAHGGNLELRLGPAAARTPP